MVLSEGLSGFRDVRLALLRRVHMCKNIIEMLGEQKEERRRKGNEERRRGVEEERNGTKRKVYFKNLLTFLK